MTTAATNTAGTAGTIPATLPGLSFGGMLHSEWIKLRSLRSTFWCYLFIVLVNVGLTALGSFATDSSGDLVKINSQVAVQLVTVGLVLSSLISAVLGSLVITGEYGTGMIQSTFTTGPRRIGAMMAKALVFAVITFVIGFVSLIIASFVFQLLLSHTETHFSLGDPKIWLVLLGGAGYLTLTGLIAFGLGAMIRSTGGALAASLGLLFVLPILMSLFGAFSATWAANVMSFLPDTLGAPLYSYGTQSFSVDHGVVSFSTAECLLLLIAWVVVTVGTALLLIKRRDV